MKENIIWTPPRSPTFFERTRLTFGALWTALSNLAGFTMVVWRSGVTVSSSRIDQQSEYVRIESANGTTVTLEMTAGALHLMDVTTL